MSERIRSTSLRQSFAAAWAFNPVLTVGLLANLLLIPATLLLMVIDPVQITGVNGWVKPFKFALSVSIYLGTLLWLLPLIQRRRRTVWLLGTAASTILLLEVAVIVLQVVRRTTSHFNNATPFDAALFAAMGIGITLLALLNMVVAIWVLRQRVGDRVLTAALRWALWVTLAGMLVAFLMTRTTPAQMEAVAAGTSDGILGAHSVGVPDGGAGLPLVGWSTEGGDLRVAHFVGLHALQALPLLAWALRRPAARRRWSGEQRTALVHIAGAAWLGLLALTTWQALRGQALIAPDALTLAAASALAALTLAAALVVTRPRTAPSTEPASRAV